MKTHRERAEEAFRVTSQATSNRDTVRVEPGVWSSPAIAIARLTFPTELVEAAKTALGFADTRALLFGDRGAAELAEALNAALEAYEETP